MSEFSKSTAASAVKSHLDNYGDVLRYLSDTMRLPPFVLRDSKAIVYLTINRTFDSWFCVKPTITKFIEHKGPSNSWKMDYSAGFTFEDVQRPRIAIAVNTAVLAQEASEAGLSNSALLEILILHECVHMAMMSWWCENCSYHSWLQDVTLRYVHETIALFFCEFGLPKIAKIATHCDIQKYLALVKSRTIYPTANRDYGPYFDEYRTLDPDKIWPAIEAKLSDKVRNSLVEGNE